MLNRLKNADTWIGALISALLAAGIFLFQATGQEPPSAMVEELSETLSTDFVGEASQEALDQDDPDAGSEADAVVAESPEEGSAEGSGQ